MYWETAQPITQQDLFALCPKLRPDSKLDIAAAKLLVCYVCECTPHATEQEQHPQEWACGSNMPETLAGGGRGSGQAGGGVCRASGDGYDAQANGRRRNERL